MAKETISSPETPQKEGKGTEKDLAASEKERILEEFVDTLKNFASICKGIPLDQKYQFKGKITEKITDFSNWLNLGNGIYLRFTEKSGRPIIAREFGDSTTTIQTGEKEIWIRENGHERPDIKIEDGKLKIPESMNGMDILGYKKNLTDMIKSINQTLTNFKADTMTDQL